MKRRKESRVRMVTNTQNNGAVKKGSEGVRKVQPHWCNNTREVVGNWTVAIQLTQVHEKVHLSLWHLLVGLLRTHKETRRRREREKVARKRERRKVGAAYCAGLSCCG